MLKRWPEKGKRKRYLILLAITAITVFAIFGDNGLLDVYRLSSERDRILSYNSSLEKENKALEREIELLKTDKDYIGSLARQELGVIGKNEIIYKVKD